MEVFKGHVDWIPVEQGKPFMDTPILLWFPKNKEIIEGTYTQRHYFRAYKTDWIYQEGEITHWAFLPEPPDND